MARSKAARKAAWHRGVFLVGVLGAIAVMGYTVWRRRSGDGSMFGGALPWQRGDGGAVMGGPAGSGRVPIAPVDRPVDDRPITMQPGWEQPFIPKGGYPTAPTGGGGGVGIEPVDDSPTRDADGNTRTGGGTRKVSLSA